MKVSLNLRANKKLLCLVLYVTILYLVAGIGIILANVGMSELVGVRFIGLAGTFLFVGFFVAYFWITHTFIRLATIFSAIFFLFSFGQYFLYGIGADFSYFFFNTPYWFGSDLMTLFYGALYSMLAICSINVGILFAAKPYNQVTLEEEAKKEETPSDVKSKKALKLVFIFLFCISYPVTIAHKVYMLYYSLSHGYAQALELQTSSIILLLNTFHLPSMVGLLIVYRKSIKKMLLLSVAVCCSAVLSLAIGGRTEAIGCLLCLGLIWLMRKKFNVKKLCIFALVAYLLLVVATTVAEVRDVQNRSLGTYASVFFKQIIGFKVFATAFGELGYNSSSVPFTMYLMQREGVQHYGLSYLAAICNIIPSSLDIFGWLEPLEKYVLLDVWVTDSFKANFGLGFSLVAESYLNFKWLGVAVMFGYGFLLGKLFAYDDLKRQNDWKIYVSFALFGALFTLPRRMSIFFVDTFFWCIICIWVAWKVMAILLNKMEKKKNGKTERR